MVDRALTLEGWRAVRRKLPGDLKRSLPMTPPANARSLLRDVLRERRQRIAIELLPVWRPKLSAVAAISGTSTRTLRQWAKDTGVPIESGRLLLRGDLVAYTNHLGANVSTADEATAWLDEQLSEKRRVADEAGSAQCSPVLIGATVGQQQMLAREPVFPWQALCFSDMGSLILSHAERLDVGSLSIQEPEYPKVGELGEHVTVDELSWLLGTSSRKIRKCLTAAGRTPRPGDEIPSAWFGTKAASGFWEAWERIRAISPLERAILEARSPQVLRESASRKTPR